jgi:hypothetical protein
MLARESSASMLPSAMGLVTRLGQKNTAKGIRGIEVKALISLRELPLTLSDVVQIVGRLQRGYRGSAYRL